MGKDLNNGWFTKCGIEWGNKTRRNNIVEGVEGLLWERFGWSEIKMREEMWRFIDIEVDEFRKYGIELCDWVYVQTDDVYFMGIALSDLYVKFVKINKNKYVKVALDTTNAIDAIFFSLLLKKPSITMSWINREMSIVAVEYYIVTKANKWGCANHEELIRRVSALEPMDVPKLIAGAVDGDSSIKYKFTASTPSIEITACRT